MDRAAWQMLQDAVGRFESPLPQKLATLVATPLELLSALPEYVEAEGYSKGYRAFAPRFEDEDPVDASYLEFLESQIARGVRGPEWTARLSARLEACSSMLGRRSRTYSFYGDGFSGFILVEGGRVWHWETFDHFGDGGAWFGHPQPSTGQPHPHGK